MKQFFLTLIISLVFSAAGYTQELIFSDKTLDNEIHLPEWFKLSFLDLQDDLDEAIADNKKGIIVYFGRKDCPYCKALLENSWGREHISYYTQKNFDVIAVNTKGVRNITDLDGFVYSEKDYSLKMKTNFTPSLLFFSKEGKIVFKLSGYQNPYRFMAALEYVADEHYKQKSFKSYLGQVNDSLEAGGQDELNHQPFFDSPPHNLSRVHFAAERPLAVFFEKSNCHACDILHSVPLQVQSIRKKLSEMDVVQVDINSKEQIITPQGLKTDNISWSDYLELHYTPTIIFYDENGTEIIRIDSVVWLNRLDRVLDFINSKAYKKYSSFQAWRLSTQPDDVKH